MTGSLLLLDAVLALTLVAIGLRVLLARDLFQSIVLFIIFGMLLGIAWCRLEAVDVALAEVAIGAGLTGALMLNTLSVTRRQSAATEALATSTPAGLPRPPLAIAAVVFTIVSVGSLAAVVIPLARLSSTPAIPIGESLPQSGIANPVTAVLLNFRAYDTLLEVAVLLGAVFAVLPMSTHARETMARPVGGILQAFARLFVPLAALVATYLLWVGTTSPGGAFQAAAILGAAGVLMIVCGARPLNCAIRRWRILLVIGSVVFLLVAVGGMVVGGRFLELPTHIAGAAVMLVEVTLTVSIALILIVLFNGTSSGPDAHGTAEGGNAFTGADGSRDRGALRAKERSP